MGPTGAARVRVRAALWCAALLALGGRGRGRARADDFDKNFIFSWTTGEPERWGEDEDIIALKLTRRSGSGFSSKNPMFHGRFGGKLKLPSGFSAGVITAFYLMSAWDQKWTEQGVDLHDEIDFEMLGNTTSAGIVVQTNWYAGGIGDHEQRHQLWFDPGADFHEYSIHLNWDHIVWLIDGIPIREEKNPNLSGTFPNLPMFLMGSIWEASSWATLGGKVPIDWNEEPFYSAFRDLYIQGCYWRHIETPEAPFCAKKDFIASWDAGFRGKEAALLKHAENHYRSYDWQVDPWRLRYGIGLLHKTEEQKDMLRKMKEEKEQRERKKEEERKKMGQRKLLSLPGGRERGRGEGERDHRLARPWVKGIDGWPAADAYA